MRHNYSDYYRTHYLLENTYTGARQVEMDLLPGDPEDQEHYRIVRRTELLVREGVLDMAQVYAEIRLPHYQGVPFQHWHYWTLLNANLLPLSSAPQWAAL